MEVIKITTLGKNIKEIRERLGITGRDLAARSGISSAYLSRIENGDKKNISYDVLEKIASGLNVPVYILFKNKAPDVIQINELPEDLRELGVEQIEIAKEASHLTKEQIALIKNLIKEMNKVN